MIAVDTSALMAIVLNEPAKEQGCRLLFVGDDFSRTDIEGVL